MKRSTKVPQDRQIDQSRRHLMGDFAREVAGDAGRINEVAIYIETTLLGPPCASWKILLETLRLMPKC
jgi:hypothetical protein